MKKIPSSKAQNVFDLGNGKFRVGSGTSPIVRTINSDQLAEWEATPLNWSSFKPTPRTR